MFKFTENSPNVAMFVRLLEAGVIDEDRVPHLFNLREVVFSIYKPKVEPEPEEEKEPETEPEDSGEVEPPDEVATGTEA